MKAKKLKSKNVLVGARSKRYDGVRNTKRFKK